jgi:[citrate (pro-3S)-lyase] ligase
MTRRLGVNMFNINQIQHNQLGEIKSLLKQFNLRYESDIDFTIAMYDQGKVIATASKARNILKCFAIDTAYQGQGITNTLVKTLEDRMFEEGLYHFFIYTTECQKDKFKDCGYQELVTESGITLLESGIQDIESYLQSLVKKHQLSQKEKACIVMNGNPFTKGHYYLVEQASQENDEVLVLVVSEDQSVFPFETRVRLIREGVANLSNVKVVETGPYLVSQATFPSYFLKEGTDVSKLHTKLDCAIFGNYYKNIFNIAKRYIGTEPYCEVTHLYNQTMLETLPQYGLEVKQVIRLESDGQSISASYVRALLKKNDWLKLKYLLPNTTYDFLKSDAAKTIIERLQQSERRH